MWPFPFAYMRAFGAQFYSYWLPYCLAEIFLLSNCLVIDIYLVIPITLQVLLSSLECWFLMDNGIMLNGLQ